MQIDELFDDSLPLPIFLSLLFFVTEFGFFIVGRVTQDNLLASTFDDNDDDEIQYNLFKLIAIDQVMSYQLPTTHTSLNPQSIGEQIGIVKSKAKNLSLSLSAVFDSKVEQ